MGFFNFNKKDIDEQSFIKWIQLTDIIQFEEIKQASKSEAVLIFKHSTRCGISRMVKRQFEQLFLEQHKNYKVYYLDLLNYRDISNLIATEFQVIHQSPQILVINNENVVFNASHYDITEIDLNRFL
ncbi:MAG: bacillithiol system redox-active protein YtxJ [Flavobacteriaceae bacterium]|nr:bacillithiol system redox-active protein YtxJ [Flavobacteriaceae bacterium]